jgi:murein DD-endopeptidase MepM/ murein hydrolase activator NlpD
LFIRRYDFWFNHNFMRREKFVFNQQTLQYDRMVEPLRYTILRFAAFGFAAVVTAFVMLLVVHRYFPSPSERMVVQENDVLRSQIASIGNDFAELSSVLDNLQDRDAGVYRVMFGAEPIDKDVWQGGRGGHDAYEDLRSLPKSGEQMADLRTKVDRFRHQLDLQSRSLDDISSMAADKEKMLASIPSIKPIRKDRFGRKIENLSGFGMRIHPIHKVNKMHYGIDFNCAKGTAIQATGNGTVEWAGKRGDYGNCVIINHGFGYKSLYGHLNEINRKNVKVGQPIKRGEHLGKVGSTGGSTGDHLHYEIHRNGERIDPIDYCYDGLTTEEYAELVKASKVSNMSFESH